MNIIFKILFFASMFIIFWAMVGYPIGLRILGKLFKNRKLVKDYSHTPTVTVMVVAHNEESVINAKLNNLIELDYPKDKIKYLIASDNSTDKTNQIVKEFIDSHKDLDITLYEAKDRKGKTNAQNEAQKVVKTEYLVMTDANSIMDKNAVKELMAAFTSEDIAYVAGRLSLINEKATDVSSAETSYWDSDVATRDIEGRIMSITGGNGAIYAIKNDEYYDFAPIKCHDSAMPTYYTLKGKRAITNLDALAYEKAGEVVEDEFGRKVRMNRLLLKNILPDIRILNIFKYRWFSFFYFGHRTCRYLLWISHLILLATNIALAFNSWIYLVLLIGQSLFYLLSFVRHLTKSENKVLTLIYYYSITVIAQWVGVYNILTGKAKPFWEKAESTRK